jgi:hypothetical protein
MPVPLVAIAVSLSVAASPLAGVEVSGGVSTLATQHVFSLTAEPALEVAVAGPARGDWRWTAGARLGLGPVLPEGFVRFSAAPALGAWSPSAGVELGLTARARFPEGDLLLREARQSAEEGIGPAYVAIHAAPLAFRAGRWRISALDLAVGTHLASPGRTFRLQVGLLAAGAML